MNVFKKLQINKIFNWIFSKKLQINKILNWILSKNLQVNKFLNWILLKKWKIITFFNWIWKNKILPQYSRKLLYNLLNFILYVKFTIFSGLTGTFSGPLILIRIKGSYVWRKPAVESIQLCDLYQWFNWIIYWFE